MHQQKLNLQMTSLKSPIPLFKGEIERDKDYIPGNDYDEEYEEEDYVEDEKEAEKRSATPQREEEPMLPTVQVPAHNFLPYSLAVSESIIGITWFRSFGTIMDAEVVKI